MLRLGLRYGHTYTTSPRLEGVAVWMRMKTPDSSFWRMLSSGALLPAMKMGMQAGQRMQTFSKSLDKKHEEMINDIHWYLQLLGVDPEYQGKGLAGKLLREMLTRIDEDGLPCYLETERQRNVPFYNRHGFDVVVEVDLPNGGPHIWTMKREPI